ncbi:MAG: Ger(x)C family spore germination protein [Oscillospiraceae bacterium]|jgi:spore germination protein KC|nr:Ger(x)C family spore germination protein [Oscillospiraceae bacterium]
MRVKAAVALLLSCAVLAVAGGCWSSSEIQDLAIVLGVAIDAAPNNGEYEITTQIARPIALNADSKQSAEDRFFNESTIGYGVAEALSRLNLQTSRRIYMSHTEVIAVCEEVAKEGLGDILDYFYRATPLRFSIPLVVCRSKAKEFFETPPKMELLPASRTSKLLWAQEFGPEPRNNTIADFLCDVLSRTSAATLPILALDGDKIILDGTAIFKGHSMVGELNEDDSKWLFLMLDELTGGTLDIKLPEGEYITITVVRSESSVTPQYENGAFSVAISSYLTFRITDTNMEVGVDSIAERERIEALMSEKATEHMLNVIKQSRDLQADIFGFGEVLYSKFPKEFEPLVEGWDSLYLELPVTVRVRTMLQSTGDILQRVE